MSYESLHELRELYMALESRIAKIEAALNSMNALRPMTEKQKAFINDICATLHIPYPEGFPNITFQAASKFIEEKKRFFFDAKYRRAQQ